MRRKNTSKEEREAEIAFSLQSTIEGHEVKRRLLLLEIGEALWEVYDKQYYKDLLGQEDATWSAFLSQPSVYFSRNATYGLFQVAKKFIKELQIPKEVLMTVPIQRFIECKNIVTKENHQELLNQAVTLTPQDWKIVLRQAKGLPVEENCPHELVKYQICKKCGLKQHE